MKGSSDLFYRITALWAISESILGGLLHGLKIPITGILVGGLAVIYLSMLARMISPKAIIKATILVMIIKGILAPHSPFGAYFAVGFQGLMGYLLFSSMPSSRFAALLLGLVNLLESALQKLIVTTLIFGMDVWVALEEFIVYVMRQMGHQGQDYLQSLLWMYLGIYTLAGLFFGIMAVWIPAKLDEYPKKYPELKLASLKVPEYSEIPKRKRRNKPGKMLILGLWSFLALLFFLQWLFPHLELLPSTRILELLIRSFLFIVGWLLVLGPLLTRWLKKWLSNKQSKWADDLEQVMGLLPQTKWLFLAAWKASGIKSGIGRLWYFGRLVLANFSAI